MSDQCQETEYFHHGLHNITETPIMYVCGGGGGAGTHIKNVRCKCHRDPKGKINQNNNNKVTTQHKVQEQQQQQQKSPVIPSFRASFMLLDFRN